MKRFFDILVSLAGLIVLCPVMILVALAVRLDTPGPALFWSRRFGAHARLFAMPKFRSMRVGTPQMPTHLLTGGSNALTGIGGFLRRSSLDELPQLWSVLVGDMSLVGPRPALFNQQDLMELRRAAGVDVLRPGITGWAQVNGRDELELHEKVAYERDYLRRQSLAFDVRIIFLTIGRVFKGSGISH